MGARYVMVFLTVLVGQGCNGQELDPGLPLAYESDLEVETQVLVPEVYELANVVLAISPYGREHQWSVHKEGDYYQRVVARFGGQSEHPLVREIQPLIESSYNGYYGFRENAFGYAFVDEVLSHEGEYGVVWTSRNVFKEHLALVRDFAEKTSFRDFFAAERGTYAEQIARYRELVDLAGMAGWLHSRFPGRRYDAYTVVFSPLIRGSHSTQRFRREGRDEAVMFIAGPDMPLGDVDDELRAALHARVVLTEIDHNYVNPVTDRHRGELQEAFGAWREWNTGENYQSAYATFNEYMTWGVFTLYAADTYAPATFAEVVRRTERQMANSRGFVRFREFNRRLLRLYREQPGLPVPDLYAPMLKWLAEAS